jgi:hypothetical protein
MKLAGEDWRPFDEVYVEFVEANPMLGLNPSEFAATRLRQQYGTELLRVGAALRLPNRRWLAHPNKFGPAVFKAMTARTTAIVDRANLRQAEQDAAP